jgi:hypothetical protein
MKDARLARSWLGSWQDTFSGLWLALQMAGPSAGVFGSVAIRFGIASFCFGTPLGMSNPIIDLATLVLKLSESPEYAQT